MANNYLTATALYRDSDLRVWVKDGPSYFPAGEFTFDSYWGTSALPSTALDVPPQRREVWDTFVRDTFHSIEDEALTTEEMLVVVSSFILSLSEAAKSPHTQRATE